MLTLVCWKWDAGLHPKKKMRFGADHVNTLYRMLQRNVQIPFRLLCITDDPSDIMPEVKTHPLWTDHRSMGGCFVRLKAFSKEMISVFGPRYCSIDLDCTIVKDITPILSCTEDFRIWGETTRKTPYCGSLWISNTGCRSQVWEQFDPTQYPVDDHGGRKRGTDQAVISDMLFPHEKMWTTDDGIYNFRHDIRRFDCSELKAQQGKLLKERNNQIQNARIDARAREMREILRSPVPVPEQDRKDRLAKADRMAAQKVQMKYLHKRNKIVQALKRKELVSHNTGDLPANARIIFFNGEDDPNNPVLQDQYPWIKEHYR